MVTRQRRGREITLSVPEVRRRAAHIKLLLTDNDGVLTDAGVYYSATGEMLKRYSIRDGLGVELLRQAGIETGIISGERSENLRRRAEKLRIRHVYLGIKNKLAHLDFLMAQTQFSRNEIAYIGDDVNDLEILNAIARAGLTGAPADAVAPVQSAVHYVSRKPGGYGAFRDFADWIIEHRTRGNKRRP
jgi:3-deoxy-D-manno-octulosonate 8-phosphate phosphatase (KDO 8-P phosphatase)